MQEKENVREERNEDDCKRADSSAEECEGVFFFIVEIKTERFEAEEIAHDGRGKYKKAEHTDGNVEGFLKRRERGERLNDEHDADDVRSRENGIQVGVWFHLL